MGKKGIYLSVDFLTLACFRDQLDALLGARVQQVVLPDKRSVGLELYAGQRFNLLASAEAQAPRILFTPEKPRRGVAGETPLLLLLRKWVKAARLVDVTQPAWERILRLHFSGGAGECELVVELVGRYSNIVLVGSNGDVLEAVKHVDPTMSRYRITLPGHPYKLPRLPQNRRPPTGLDVGDWEHMLARADVDEALSDWLVRQLLGVGPMVADEIAARVADDPDALVRAATPQALGQAIEELFGPLENGWWQPHVALDDSDEVIAFTPYETCQFEKVEPARDISQAMWRYYEAHGLADPYAAARGAVQAVIDRARKRLEKRLEHVRESGVEPSEIDALRIAGELLLTYQHRVERGMDEVVLPDYAGDPRAICIDPKLSAVDNARDYFRRYDKARRAADKIPMLIAQTETEQAFVEQLEADLAMAESRPEIDAVLDALAAAGWSPRGGRSSAQLSGPRRFELEGFPIYVGRNARQNEHVTFKRAAPEDYWLHVRGLPGAHVVIKRGRREVPDRVVRRAGQLAAYYSRARDSATEVAVDMTERRYVHRLRGSYPGLVTYRNEQTIWVRPESAGPNDQWGE